MKVAFCWELGRGLGHIVHHRALIERLVARGDEILFIGRDRNALEAAFSELPVAKIEFVGPATPPHALIRQADSYAEILNNTGIVDIEAVYTKVVELRERLTAFKPDVLITEFAPLALIANRQHNFPFIVAGDGYTIPPQTASLPRFRYWEGAADARHEKHEQRVVNVVNGVLAKIGVAPLSCLADLFAADAEWLKTFKELDFYPNRDAPRYLGSFVTRDFGVAPVWPGQSRMRVFAYLRESKVCEIALETLCEMGVTVCVYTPNGQSFEGLATKYENLYVSREPVCLVSAVADADLVLTNGNIHTTTASLLGGTPLLMFPNTAERYINARHVEVLGAGLAAPLARPGDISAKVRAMLRDPRYKNNAQSFAQNYARMSVDHQVETMLKDLDNVVDRARTKRSIKVSQ